MKQWKAVDKLYNFKWSLMIRKIKKKTIKFAEIANGLSIFIFTFGPQLIIMTFNFSAIFIFSGGLYAISRAHDYWVNFSPS